MRLLLFVLLLLLTLPISAVEWGLPTVPPQDCPVIDGEDVTSQWWLDARGKNGYEAQQIAIARFMPYRHFEQPFFKDGVWQNHNTNPQRDDYLLYVGLYIGLDGYPHASCGVYIIHE